jgi:predicted metal-dependent HD superfamily phosphohydrolase
MSDYVVRPASCDQIAQMIRRVRPLSRLNETAVAEGIATVFSAYAEPHRGHHDLLHLQECFGWLYHLEQLLPAFKDYEVDSLILSLAYHDFFYVPAAMDNELRSAMAGRVFAAKIGAAPPTIQCTEDFILATLPSERPLREIVQLQHDIDWWAVGSPRPRYQQYAVGIRKEFDDGSGAYQLGRRSFLEDCLEKQVFLTPLFSIFEDQAQANILWEIEQLPE